MAVEIAAVRGCDTCAGALCPRCLGCIECPQIAIACGCPTEEPAERTAWLVARCRLGAHADDCFSCALAWVPDCETGVALQAAAHAAWAAYLEASR